MPIKDWNEDDRPREKLMTKGASSCSTAELLAILITNGTSGKSAVELGQEIMNACGNNLVNFTRSTMETYKTVKGIGDGKACIIKAAAELGNRIHLANLGESIKVKSTHEAYELMRFLRFLAVEEFWAIFTNNSGLLLQKIKIADGDAGNVPIDLRKLAFLAINCNATRVILCHNHPGGTPAPSHEDTVLTQSIVSLMKLLRITVVEHIIIAGDTYFSFLEEGIL